MDVPATPTSFPLYVPLASEYMSLSYASLYNLGPSSKSRAESSVFTSTLLDYNNDQLAIANSWDGTFHMVSIFGTKKTWPEDASNIFKSIKRISSYIKSHPVETSLPSTDFVPVIKGL